MDILLSDQLRNTPSNPQRRFRRQRLENLHPPALLQNRFDIYFPGSNMVGNQIQGPEYVPPNPIYSPLTSYAETPLVVTFAIMFVATICFAFIQPSWGTPQIIFTALTGIGCAGPLTLLVACVQFTAPHAFLSTATGLAFSARAIGGAFGTAVIYAIVNSRVASKLPGEVGSAAIAAGLPASSVSALLKGMKGSSASKFRRKGVLGASEAIMIAAWDASH